MTREVEPRGQSARGALPTIGEWRIMPGLSVATMPQRLGVEEHEVDGQEFAVLIYSRKARELRDPPDLKQADRKVLAGSVGFIPAGLKTYWRYQEPLYEKPGRLAALHLRFAGDVLRALNVAGEPVTRRMTLNLAIPGLAQRMEDALAAYEASGPLKLLSLQTAGLSAAAKLFAPSPNPALGSALTTQRRRALRDFVDESDPEDITLTGMADTIGLTPRRLLEVFKDATGMTPAAWARARRSSAGGQDNVE